MNIEQELRCGSLKIIPPLKRYSPMAYATTEEEVPKVAQTVAWDMNDLRRMDKDALRLLISDLAAEHHIYAAMGWESLVPDADDGCLYWHDRWMGYTRHTDEKEFLIHKAYALLVSIVLPELFHKLK